MLDELELRLNDVDLRSEQLEHDVKALRRNMAELLRIVRIISAKFKHDANSTLAACSMVYDVLNEDEA